MNDNRDVLNLQTWDNFFNKVPCVKDSLITGIAMGSIMTLHRRRTNIITSSAYGMAAFGFGTIASFAICAYSHNNNVKKAKEAIANKQKLQRASSTPANLNRRANPNLQELKSQSNPTQIIQDKK